MNEPVAPRHRRIVTLLVVLAALIVGRITMVVVERPAGQRPADLELLPSPDVSRLEPLIRRQITSARAEAERNPGDFQANARLAMIYHAHGLLDEALAIYPRAISLSPCGFEVRYLYAQACDRAGDLQAAIEECRRVTEMEPACRPAWLLLGRLHWERDELRDAESAFAGVRQGDPRCAAACYWLGRIRARNGQLDAAVTDLETALELSPGHPDILYALGLVLRDRGDGQRAAELLRRSQEVPPRGLYPDPYMDQLDRLRSGAEASFQRGYYLAEAGRLEEAAGQYRDALAIDPDLAEGHQNLGVVLLRLGRLAEAAAELRLAIEADPNLGQAHTNLGNALARLGRDDEARRHYEEALVVDPHSPSAQNDYAGFLMSIGDFEAAVARYHHAIEVAPGDLPPRVNLGIALHNLGRFDEAVAAYRQAQALRPADPRLLAFVGQALLDAGRLDEAVAHLGEAVRAAPDQPGLFALFGAALAEVERFTDAIAAYRQALATAGFDSQIAREFHDLLVSRRMYAQAANLLRGVLEVVPDHAAAAERLAWLLATAPGAELRDGAEALSLATRISAASDDPPATVLLTLAAAQAEMNQFDQALATLEHARRQARAKGEHETIGDIDRAAELFARRRPYRLPE